METLQRELTFQVLYVEVFKFPLDLAEQVEEIAPQGQRKLGVLQGSKVEVAIAAHVQPHNNSQMVELRAF